MGENGKEQEKRERWPIMDGLSGVGTLSGQFESVSARRL